MAVTEASVRFGNADSSVTGMLWRSGHERAVLEPGGTASRAGGGWKNGVRSPNAICGNVFRSAQGQENADKPHYVKLTSAHSRWINQTQACIHDFRVLVHDTSIRQCRDNGMSVFVCQVEEGMMPE